MCWQCETFLFLIWSYDVLWEYKKHFWFFFFLIFLQQNKQFSVTYIQFILIFFKTDCDHLIQSTACSSKRTHWCTSNMSPSLSPAATPNNHFVFSFFEFCTVESVPYFYNHPQKHFASFQGPFSNQKQSGLSNWNSNNKKTTVLKSQSTGSQNFFFPCMPQEIQKHLSEGPHQCFCTLPFINYKLYSHLQKLACLLLILCFFICLCFSDFSGS